MEAVFIDMHQSPVGLQQFAPNQAARGPMFSARARAGIGGEQTLPPAVLEDAAASR
jgi:hypothetical protein